MKTYFLGGKAKEIAVTLDSMKEKAEEAISEVKTEEEFRKILTDAAEKTQELWKQLMALFGFPLDTPAYINADFYKEHGHIYLAILPLCGCSSRTTETVH